MCDITRTDQCHKFEKALLTAVNLKIMKCLSIKDLKFVEMYSAKKEVISANLDKMLLGIFPRGVVPCLYPFSGTLVQRMQTGL